MPTITGPIVPGGTTFPGMEDVHLKGGFRCVADLAALNAIPAVLRKPGMRVYVMSEILEYVLAADNVSWQPSLYLLTTEQNLTYEQLITVHRNLEVGVVDDACGFPPVFSRGIEVASGTRVTPGPGVAFGMSGPVGSNLRVACLNLGNQGRVYNSGTITAMEWYMPQTLPADCEIEFMIWRLGRERYELIGRTGDLRSLCTADDAVHKVSLPQPIRNVRIGDMIGAEIRYVSGSWGAGLHTVMTPVSGIWSSQDIRVGYQVEMRSGAPWDAAALFVGKTLPVRCYMNSPVMVITGDSRVSGYPGTQSLITPTTNWHLRSDMAFRIEQLLGHPVRNMSFEGDSTRDMLARFTSDVVTAKASLVGIFMGGVNDMYEQPTQVDHTEMVANIKAMTDAALADGSKVFIVSDYPFQAIQTNNPADWDIQSVDSDQRCLEIQELAQSYDPTEVLWIDLRADLGTLRPDTGSPNWQSGNVWNLQPLFWASDADKTHMSPSGAFRMARSVVKNLRDWLRYEASAP